MATTTAPTNHVETPAEEYSRYLAETSRRDAEVDQAINALLDEGFGDALTGALTVLLDPNTLNFSLEQRQTAITATVLRMVVERDLDRAAAAQS